MGWFRNLFCRLFKDRRRVVVVNWKDISEKVGVSVKSHEELAKVLKRTKV